MGQDSLAVAENPDSIDGLIRQIEGLPKEGIYVAIAIGLLLFIIGWFGGTKNTPKKVLTCIILVTVVGIFSLPVATALYKWLAPGLSPVGAFSVVYLVWCLYLIGMAISLYETLIVTADEARPN
ncbi:MAG: hypothetical protein H6695_00670 [Deferribacteres bacterium]|nr:hypothetical protein [candidate division KSB1 bacterium]MCB9508662.1 hypothetical protein [Deferribacteres bacterium]